MSSVTTSRGECVSSAGGWGGISLSALGCVSAIGYVAAALWNQSSTSSYELNGMILVFSCLAIVWAVALRKASRVQPRLGVIVGFAVFFRLLLLPAGYSFQEGNYQRLLLFDDHVWRYLWEGHVWSAGVSPLSVPPAALDEYAIDDRNENLAKTLYDSAVWSEVFERVGNPQMASPYPVAAHGLFRFAHALAPGSVLFWKLLMLGFDIGTLLLLVRLAQRHALGLLPVLAYGWNPLVIKEFVGSAHVDAALVFFLVLAVSTPRLLGGVALGAATLIKPVALLLAPALFRRGGWRALAVPSISAVAFWQFLPRGLGSLATDWTFNPVFHRIFPMPRAASLVIAATILIGVAAYCFGKDDGTERSLFNQAVWLFGALLLLSPALAPWYLTWLIPFAALTQSVMWLTLSGSMFVSYHSAFDLPDIPLLALLQFAIPVLIWLRSREGGDPATDRVEVGRVLSLSWFVGVAGGLCCLSPIVIVLLGLSNMAFASAVGDLFYGEYRWLFRLLSIVLGGLALLRYFRSQGVCTVDDAKRHRTWIINVAMLTVFSSVSVYILFTYVVLQEWGILVGLPWAQYDESWAIPASVAMFALVAFLIRWLGEGFPKRRVNAEQHQPEL